MTLKSSIKYNLTSFSTKTQIKPLFCTPCLGQWKWGMKKSRAPLNWILIKKEKPKKPRNPLWGRRADIDHVTDQYWSQRGKPASNFCLQYYSWRTECTFKLLQVCPGSSCKRENWDLIPFYHIKSDEIIDLFLLWIIIDMDYYR